jgi:hypothetical protein
MPSFIPSCPAADSIIDAAMHARPTKRGDNLVTFDADAVT